MKKTISLLVLTAAIALGAVSCSKNNEGVEGTEGNAQLSISYGFKDSQAIGRAASTAKPETNWNVNIKSLTLILTKTDGTITHVLNPTVPAGGGIAQQTMATITNLVQDTYNVYLIANGAGAVASSPHGTAAINPSMALTSAALVGQNINSLNFGMVAAGSLPGGIVAANQEPTEIFWDKQTVTVGTGNNSIALQLERAVSLMRVRINKDFVENGVAYNAGVTFNNASASLLLRRTDGSAIAASTGSVAGAITPMFSPKPFKTANPASGYLPSDMGLNGADNFTYWNDYLILPGGDMDVNAGFDIVLTGLAPVGYIARDNAGVVLPALTAPEPVFWTAGVSGVAVNNGILELNVTLKSMGVIDTVIPDPATYGNLDITATLTVWGNITSIDMPI